MGRGYGASFSFRQSSMNELSRQHYLSLLVESQDNIPTEAFIIDVRAEGNEIDDFVERRMLLLCIAPGREDVPTRDANQIADVYRSIDDVRRRMNAMLDISDALRNNRAYPFGSVDRRY